MNPARELYFDLMKRCLVNMIYADSELEDVPLETDEEKKELSKFSANGYRLMKRREFNRKAREEGHEWPPFAHSMVGLPRLENIRFCIERIIENKVPGDLIETGVWRGGACIFMRAVLKAYGISDRNVWLADSFEGLPKPNEDKYPADTGLDLSGFRELAVSMEEVQENFRAYDLLDEQVRFLKGWFKDTLPTAPIDKLALIRLDGDLYESTMDGLINLYPKLSVGGYIIVDDFGVLEACKQAVDDFRSSNGISDKIETIDWTGVYWQKT